MGRLLGKHDGIRQPPSWRVDAAGAHVVRSGHMEFAYAGVAELVDAPGLGPGDCKVVGVQVPSPAPIRPTRWRKIED